MYYLQSRYYDPATMRFINADDPNVIQMGTEEKQELNLYAYCVNDPVNSVDPTGYDAIWINSYSAAATFGHASLLIESSPNVWNYFFWGPQNLLQAIKSTTGASVPRKVLFYQIYVTISKSQYYLSLNSLNRVLKSFDSGLNIAGGERYTSYVYIKGDFSALKGYINSYMRGTNAPKYSLYHCNCAYMSVKALLRGKLTWNQRQALNKLINGGTLIPNNVISRISSIFGRVVRY